MPKIGDFSGEVDIKSKRDVLKINRFPLVVFFRKKFSRAESCAEFTILMVRKMNHLTNYELFPF